MFREVNEHRRQRWTAFRARKQKEKVTVGWGGRGKKNIEMRTSLVNCVIQLLWDIRKCLKGFMEVCICKVVVVVGGASQKGIPLQNVLISLLYPMNHSSLSSSINQAAGRCPRRSCH